MKSKDKIPEGCEVICFRRMCEGHIDKIPYCPFWDEERSQCNDRAQYLAGIKEVVEWMEKYKKIKVSKYQLKKWGIK